MNARSVMASVRRGGRTRSVRPRGDSLIEVMIALSIAAVTALGLVAMQSALAKAERTALLSERAALIADSIGEATRGSADSSAMLSRWRARAAALLPDGDIAILDRGNGVQVATVSWHVAEGAEPCPEPQARPHTSCIAMAFAR
jgi:type IV pilus assembly protein PilV